MFEKVNPAHPDKIADRIAGALVDLAYKSERNPRIAVEVLIGHGTCHIIAETSVQLSIDDVTAAVQNDIAPLHTASCSRRSNKLGCSMSVSSPRRYATPSA